jgi:O-antigen ligase
MQRFLAAAIGFFSLTPGLAVFSVRGVGVQPLVLLLLVYAFLIPAQNGRVRIQSLIWLAVTLASSVLSTIFSQSPSWSMPFAVMQGAYVVLAAIALSGVLGVPEERQAFARGYVTAALFSSAVAFAQLVYTATTGVAITLANNVNFAIVAIYDRGAAFTPESSALASLLLPAILVCWFEHEKRAGLLAPWQRNWPALLLLALGLISTKSSSLFYAPILFVLVAAFQSSRLVEFTRTVGKVLVPLVLAAVVYLPLYGTRTVTPDAESSMAWRLMKVDAGLRIFEASPVVGAGLGLVSDGDYFESYLVIPPDLAWNTEPHKGVDSTAIRILAETGILGFAAFYYPLVVCFRRMRALCKAPAFCTIAILSLGLLFSQIFMSGYRDQIIFLLPSIAFALSGGTRVRSAARPASREEVLPGRALARSANAQHWST